MTTSPELLELILELALTSATLTIPAVSIAYVIVNFNEDEKERMTKVIAYGSLSAIMFILCSFFTFAVLCLGYENESLSLIISSIMFGGGLILLLYVLIILAGFKRDLPMPKNQK